MANFGGIHITKLPELDQPLFIAGFEGWGNALDISSGIVEYMISALDGREFGFVESDMYFRYDQYRPFVVIDQGELKGINPPGGRLYWAKAETRQGHRDIVLFKSHEPELNWFGFTRSIFSLCRELNVETFITVGSLYDNVLHTERIISGLVSDTKLIDHLSQNKVLPATYRGPGAIHTLIMAEAEKRGYRCFSFWGHCPCYIDGISHYGIMSELGSIISSIGGFSLDIQPLEKKWIRLSEKIHYFIENNPEFQEAINDIKMARQEEKNPSRPQAVKKTGKIIHLDHYLDVK